MKLREVCVSLIILFLASFVRADVDLHALVDKIKEFTTQIEDTVVAAKLQAEADKLIAQPVSLIQQIRTIGNITQVLEGNKNALDLILDCIDARDALEEIPHEMLKRKALDYFSKRFPDAEIEFSTKDEGRQLGDCLRIVQSGCPEIIYYIKTHSHGLCAALDSWDSQEAEPVRPEELLVYKFFEYSKLGPEVHFFWYNERDFYIATKDIGCTESGKVEIYTYETIKATPRLLGITYPKSRFEPSQEVSINRKVIQSLVFVDVFTRVFGLEDLITNPGNFYFICNIPGHISDFKIIDFRIGRRTATPSTIFSSFLMGFGGPYCYLGFSDTISRYLFVHKDKVAKIETTKSFFLPNERTFTRAMIQSLGDMQDLQKAIPTLNNTQFTNYCQCVVENMTAFVKGLRNPPLASEL